MSRNADAEVKERDGYQPCFLLLDLGADISLGDQTVVIDLPEGTGLAGAVALRDALHGSGASIKPL